MDRLAELRGELDAESKEAELSGGDTPEIGKLTVAYEPVKQGMQVIVQNTTKLRNYREKEKKTANENDRRQIMQQVNNIMSETQQQGQLIKGKLQVIAAANAASKDAKTSAVYQMRENLYSKNAKSFQDAMRDFNSASEEFKNTLQDRTRRELKNVGVKEDDIERVVESGNANEILQQAHLSENVDDMVLEIESRHSSILQLERQVLEVQELFLDLANLVSIQGETIDNIESHIVAAKAHTENAADQVSMAEDYQKKARKRQCCIVVIVVVCLLVIIGPILGKFT